MEIFKLFGSILVDDKEANKSISRTDKNAKTLGDQLSNGIKTAGKWGIAIAGGATVAAGAIGALAVPFVKSAANAQAMNAQFAQVFKDMQDNAQSTINDLGKKFGMLPNRIKPAMSTMTSMFMGLGMDTESAMETAKNAVTLTADAAAFYDKSFEDANSALNSFIKGNYEGGEAIGLFANETQLASWASKNLGVDWKNLDEAGKQIARLEYAKAMQESAGATGQATRESNSLENQLGNLKQVWEDIKAKFGAPILEPAVNGLKSLASWLQNVNTDTLVTGFDFIVDAAGNFFVFIKENVLPILVDLYEWIKPHMPEIQNLFEKSVGVIKDLLGGFRDGIKFVKDNMNWLLPVIIGVTSAIVAQMIIEGLVTLYKSWQTVTKTQTTLQWLLNVALNANPLGLIALAIGAVIAVGVLLWKNWDTVKNYATSLWDKLGNMKSMLLGLLGPFGLIVGAGVSLYKNWDKLVAKAKEIAGKIKGFFSGMKIELPHIKLPHFTIKNWSINPLDWIDKKPSLGINWYAAGTDYAPGGLAVVGEQGPELINLPRGSKVHTADETEGMLGGNKVEFNITNHYTKDESTPSEYNRKQKQMLRELALEWGLT